ncbi:MAG TPA: Calx-beta domain-containing protein [Anaerolineae bacterium]
MAFSTANVATGEVNAGVTITVILSIPTTQNVTVNYATFDGTATAGSDYVAVSGILTFTPGQVSQSFIVPILDDSINEVAETVGLQLSAPVNGTLGTPNPATLTISDNDPVTVQFSSSTYSVDEDAGPALIAVTLSTTSTQTIAVNYATSELLATADLDYTDVNDVLTFAPGQTSLNFSVPIINDDLQEPDETVQLTLSSPTNATLGTPNPATLTIVDDGDVIVGCPGTTSAGEPDIIPPPPPALTPDGIFAEVGCGTALIVDLGLTVIDTTTSDPAYDLVYYERGQPNPPTMTNTFIFMDWIVVQIGPTATGPWYNVFYWGDNIDDTNSNVNWTALGLAMEDNNVTISTTFLYDGIDPVYSTGIAIDVDNSPLSPAPPPGLYQFVRFLNPSNPTNDPPEIDAIEVLP